MKEYCRQTMQMTLSGRDELPVRGDCSFHTGEEQGGERRERGRDSASDGEKGGEEREGEEKERKGEREGRRRREIHTTPQLDKALQLSDGSLSFSIMIPQGVSPPPPFSLPFLSPLSLLSLRLPSTSPFRTLEEGLELIGGEREERRGGEEEWEGGVVCQSTHSIMLLNKSTIATQIAPPFLPSLLFTGKGGEGREGRERDNVSTCHLRVNGSVSGY